MRPDEFIDTIAPFVVEDMKRSRVLASLTLAQAALESGWGTSTLTTVGKNLFGIKGVGGVYDTREFIAGEWIDVKAGFRHYTDWAGSIRDHSDLLLGLTRYAAVIGERDYVTACHAIQDAGYATDPNYADLLIGIIEQHGLYRYDVWEPENESGEGEDSVEPVEQWKQDIIDQAIAAGIITEQHDPNETAKKWFVLQVIMNNNKNIVDALR